MKNILKNSAVLMALIGSIMTAQYARAIDYGIQSNILAGGTIILSNAAVYNLTNASAVNLNKFSDMVLCVTGKGMAATVTTNCLLRWSMSADGTNFATLGGTAMTNNTALGYVNITPNGTTKFCYLTNFNVGSYGWWRVDYLSNANSEVTEVLTNLSISVWTKPKWRGP